MPLANPQTMRNREIHEEIGLAQRFDFFLAQPVDIDLSLLITLPFPFVLVCTYTDRVQRSDEVITVVVGRVLLALDLQLALAFCMMFL